MENYDITNRKLLKDLTLEDLKSKTCWEHLIELAIKFDKIEK